MIEPRDELFEMACNQSDDAIAREEVCKYLATAQGWTYEVGPGQAWTKWTRPDKSYWRMVPPDPFTKADDLLTLLEWARRQEWWDYLGIGSSAIVLLGHDGEFEGAFQEALPIAVYRALKEVEE